LSSRAEKEAVSAGSSALFFVAMRLGEDLGALAQVTKQSFLMDQQPVVTRVKPMFLGQ
jgi:hypothetical protein